jgi:hypothetical protein
MTLASSQIELLSGILGFIFTVALLSYLIGDNVFYRLAIHIFVGVAVGYATLVVIYQVLAPRLVTPLTSGDAAQTALAVVPLILFIFLILKLSPRTAALGNTSIGYLIGVGTAVAVGGAVTGTLIPQVRSTWLSLLPDLRGSFINHAIVIAGTIATLIAFQFWLRGRTPGGEPGRARVMQALATAGQFFIVLTLGAVYGGMILSGIAALSDRLSALIGWIAALFS